MNPTRQTRIAILAGVLILLTLGLLWGGIALTKGIQEDKLWKARIQRDISPEELRAWALGAMQFYSTEMAHEDIQSWLASAPRPVLESYRRPPTLIITPASNGTPYCLHLRYGGGMYDWGLTIGAEDLPIEAARGKLAEEWVPGIYFWSN